MSYDRTCKAHSLAALDRPDIDRDISDHYRHRFMGDPGVTVPAATSTPSNRGTLAYDDSRRSESFSACT
jgi:hypothetical protein